MSTPLSILSVDGAAAGLSDSSTPPEKRSKTPRKKGRKPRNDLLEEIYFHCQSVDDLKIRLKGFFAGDNEKSAETSLIFEFQPTSAFLVNNGSTRCGLPTAPSADNEYGALNKVVINVIDALAPTGNPKDNIAKQKSIAKALVEAVQQADGFKYSFHNSWISKTEAASRLSYYCNDSVLNKGRAANESSRSAGRTVRKPVYDCQGLITVKFSTAKQTLELFYRHDPIHKTYEERAPPPRSGSRRKRLKEISDPDDRHIWRVDRSFPDASIVEESGLQAQLDLSQNTDGRLYPPIEESVPAGNEAPTLPGFHRDHENFGPYIMQGTQRVRPLFSSPEPTPRATVQNLNQVPTHQSRQSNVLSVSRNSTGRARQSRGSFSLEQNASVLSEIDQLREKLLAAERRIADLERGLEKA